MVPIMDKPNMTAAKHAAIMANHMNVEIYNTNSNTMLSILFS